MTTACKLDGLPRGNTRELTVTVTLDGVAVDLTGDSVILTLKANPRDTIAALTKTNTSHSDPANGITIFTISNTESLALSVKQHYADVTWINDSDAGQVTTVYSGTINIIEPVRTPV